jgi:hypothetical protein
MKRYSIDQTFQHLREMPEEVSFEEIAAFAVATPIAAGAGFAVSKLIVQLFKIKYFIPMFLSGTTTLTVAIYLGIQTFTANPSDPSGNPSSASHPTESRIDLQKDQPFGGMTILADTTKKQRKITRTNEVRIIKKDGDTSMADLPELPPLPPLPPGKPTINGKAPRKEIRREERVIENGNISGDENAKKGCGEDDAFITAMVQYLSKQGLITNNEKFDLELKPNSLTVNGNTASSQHLKEVLKMFSKLEKKSLSGESSIEMKKSSNTCTVTKSIVD